MRGKSLDARGLSRHLGDYGIKSRLIRFGEDVRRGYRREDLCDAWERYLPKALTESVTRVTGVTDADAVTGVTDVTQPASVAGRWHADADIPF
jgi:hypothetical protein